MNKMSKGGKNLCYFFRYKLKSDGSAYDVLDALTDAVAATPALANAAFKLEGVIGSSKPQIQDTGLVNFSFDQYACSEDIFAFLDKVVTTAAAGATTEVNFEDGTKAGGTTGDANDVILLISYLHGNDIDSPTKRMVYSAIGTINPTSGSFETSSDTFTKPTFEFIGKTVGKDIEIAAAMYDDELVTVSAAKTITAGKNFIRPFETIAA